MASAGEELESVEEVLNKYIPGNELKEVYRVLYGRDVEKIEFSAKARELSEKHNFELKGYKITAKSEELRPERIVRIGAVQNKVAVSPSSPLNVQREQIYAKISKIIEAAHQCGVNVLCLQEAWPMPFAFCTGEKHPWCQFSESAENGPTTQFLQELCRRFDIVIISPILERDEDHGDVLWNTAVVIDNQGRVLGKHRKNHIPRVGVFNESKYYMEGNTGHPVFQTKFGKIAVNICYGRHHPQNWMMFGINGAEIVFNPSATIANLSEHLWGLEARNAAVANSYFTVAVNRVGTETYPDEFAPGLKDLGPFYGASYITAPDGTRTPGLSRTRDGLLVTEVDLNLCRQVRDEWGFRTTQRIDLYAESLKKAVEIDYKPQLIQ